MSVYLGVDDEPLSQLASVQGWADTRAWVAAHSQFGELLHLVSEGWSDDVAKLTAELDDAQPEDKDVASVLTGLAADLKEGATVAYIV